MAASLPADAWLPSYADILRRWLAEGCRVHFSPPFRNVLDWCDEIGRPDLAHKFVMAESHEQERPILNEILHYYKHKTNGGIQSSTEDSVGYA